MIITWIHPCVNLTFPYQVLVLGVELCHGLQMQLVDTAKNQSAIVALVLSWFAARTQAHQAPRKAFYRSRGGHGTIVFCMIINGVQPPASSYAVLGAINEPASDGTMCPFSSFHPRWQVGQMRTEPT
jgi:hypothetical protein